MGNRPRLPLSDDELLARFTSAALTGMLADPSHDMSQRTAARLAVEHAREALDELRNRRHGALTPPPACSECGVRVGRHEKGRSKGA